VKVMNRAKVMAQLTVNGFIRATNQLDPSLEYCTHHVSQQFWQHVLMMCIYGGPRPASSHGRDFTIDECANQEFPEGLQTPLQRVRYAANRAWYLMWGDHTFERMSIWGLGPTADLTADMGKEMAKELASHVIGKLPELMEKCRDLGVEPVSAVPPNVPGIATFLSYNNSLPDHQKWKVCPISGFTEGYVAFTERSLLSIISGLEFPWEVERQRRDKLGQRLLKKFMNTMESEIQ
jgi:hypothetical protein